MNERRDAHDPLGVASRVPPAAVGSLSKHICRMPESVGSGADVSPRTRHPSRLRPQVPTRVARRSRWDFRQLTPCRPEQRRRGAARSAPLPIHRLNETVCGDRFLRPVTPTRSSRSRYRPTARPFTAAVAARARNEPDLQTRRGDRRGSCFPDVRPDDESTSRCRPNGRREVAGRSPSPGKG